MKKKIEITKKNFTIKDLIKNLKIYPKDAIVEINDKNNFIQREVNNIFYDPNYNTITLGVK